jgi:hypothetical protein
MKKFALLFIAVLGLQFANAQDEGKSFRFGLRLDPSINWFKVDNEKKFENGGAGVGFGWGLHTEIKLSENASWTNAIGLFYDKGNIDFATASNSDSTYYLLNKDDEVIEFPSDNQIGFGVDTSLYLLKSRSYSINYAHLQTCIKMKTKEIGMITYFGQFGLNLGIKTKARVNDETSKFDITSSLGWSDHPNEKIDITKDAAFMKLGINIGFGLEFNISGSTSAFACLSYNHGFTNAVKSDSDYLRKYNNSTNKLESITQKVTARNIALTIGILF